MARKLTVYINNQSAIEYDREKHLEDKQLEFLEKMDADMNRGVKMGDELFENPDQLQRAKFVAMNLVNAVLQDKEAIIAATCAYLASRLPDLLEVRANDHGDSVIIDLINDHGQPVEFSMSIN